MLCLSVACFWCQSFGDVSPYVCSHYFSSVSLTEWPPFMKWLLTWFTYVLFVFLPFEILVISCFGFEGCIWVLIASVYDLCILFTLSRTQVSN